MATQAGRVTPHNGDFRRRAVDQIEPPFNYTSDVASLVPTYLRLIPEYRVLIYNGDVDPCVPYNGNEEWTRGQYLSRRSHPPTAPFHNILPNKCGARFILHVFEGPADGDGNT